MTRRSLWTLANRLIIDPQLWLSKKILATPGPGESGTERAGAAFSC